MHVDIYTFNSKYRFSFKELENQIALGLDKLLPDPHYKQHDFDERTGKVRFKLGREGSKLSNSEGELVLGDREMRATASGDSLGIRLVEGQALVRVPVMREGEFLFFILPRNFYEVRTDNLMAQLGV